MFVNVSGSSVVLVASAVSVPSPLSVTVTVTVLVASASFVTPSTSPDSVTSYVYSPGAVYVNGPNVVVGEVLLIAPLIVSASGAPSTAATSTSKLQSAGPSSPSGTLSIFSTGKLAVVGVGLYLLVTVNTIVPSCPSLLTGPSFV